jgi:hypothetical protein
MSINRHVEREDERLKVDRSFIKVVADVPINLDLVTTEPDSCPTVIQRCRSPSIE